MPDEAPAGPWTADAIAKLLAPEPPPARASLERREAFLRAAAVLVWYDPQTLRPLSGEPDPPAAVALLAEDSRPAPGRGDARARRLRSKTRRAVLARMGTRAALTEALERNEPFPDPDDNLQRLLAAAIRGKLPPLERQTTVELACTLQVAQWLRDVPGLGLPPISELRACVERARLLEPFRTLADEHFAGREKELRRLREHVGVLEPGNALGRAVRRYTEPRKAVLVVHGPGGIGKSTLLARFILDHASLDVHERLAFVCVDFEDSTLDPADWRTWATTAVRQLAAQATARAGSEQHGDVEAMTATLLDSLAAASADPSSVAAPLARLAHAAAGQVSRADIAYGREARLLFVADSLEEVQYHGSTPLYMLGRLIDVFGRAHGALCPVVVGRAPVELTVTGRSNDRLPLDEFDAAAATAFLRRLGVADRVTAAAVARQVGGNPLSLKLAAGVLANEDGTADHRIEGLPRRRLLSLLRAKDAVIQGHLYGRILAHVRDPEVRALAEPGLVLRRITPGVLAEVLAPVCGEPPEGGHTAPLDPKRAHARFEDLRREAALVLVADDGSLRYRPEIRAALLRLLQQRDPALVERVDRAAVAFYAQCDDVESRAEELYHRLRLREEPADLDARWLDGVEPRLMSAVEELAAPERAYLAARLGLELDSGARSEARQVDWERQAARAARELLDAGAAQSAIARLQERRERSPGSAVRAVEAEALLALGSLADARAVIDAGLADAVALDGRPEQLVRLHELGAGVAEAEGDDAAVRDHLDGAIAAAQMMGDQLRLLGLEVRRFRASTGEEQAALGARLAADFAAVPDAELAADGDLVRAVAEALGADHPALLQRALLLAPLTELAPDRREQLAVALADADAGAAKTAGTSLLAVGARNFQIDLGTEDPESTGWGSVLEGAQRRGRLSDLVSRALTLAAGHPAVLACIALAMGEERAEHLTRRVR
jgi:hypothetical protein